MTPSPSVVAAATTLADWARERRDGWSDVPLEIPEIPPQLVELPGLVEMVELVEPVALEPITEQAIEVFDDPIDEPTEEPVARPSVFAAVTAVLKVCVEYLEPLGEPLAAWLMRGAAVVSLISVVMFIGVNRGEVFARWDRAVATVTTRLETPPAPAAIPPPAGTGRLTVTSSEGMAQVFVDGSPKGVAPLTVDLSAGAHRVLLKSPAGSVERVVRIRAGEPSDVTESIFPGWLALTTAVDLTMSEAGQPLKRDERGWAILAPGPHDIHLDNRALGVHEVRRVVVTPGDTTRLSFMPHASTMSLTTNEVADVWIDGTSFGQAPLVDQPIAVGVHDVRVRSALHEKWLRIRATVQPVQVNVDLTAQ